jgi:succinate dehydrogenase / fumarate reductase, flavoprotein subunit
VGAMQNGVFLDFRDAIQRLGKDVIAARYGNLFEMYEKITGEDPYQVPMRIYPAPHYTMGGLWVDYNLESTIPACSWAARPTSATTAPTGWAPAPSCRGWPTATSSCPPRSAISWPGPGTAMATKATRRSRRRWKGSGKARAASSPSRATGRWTSSTATWASLMWDHVGMARDADGLRKVIGLIPELRERFWKEVRVPGSADSLNQSLEVAGRVADFLEFGELMARDALDREESAGGHLRVEHTTPEGEASATTMPSRSSPCGSSPGRTPRRSGTRSRCSSST